MELDPRVRSAITLGVLCLMLLLGLVVGWNAVTAPLPSLTSESSTEPTDCADPTNLPDEQLTADQVTVNVYNAGHTAGQASTTLAGLVRRGFDGGEAANAPSGVRIRAVQVWTTDPEDTAARLVARQFRPHARIVAKEPLSDGVTVIVGNHVPPFAKVRPASTPTDDTTC